MAIKWSEGRYGSERASIGPFDMVVHWVSSADKFGLEIPSIGIRIRGFAEMDAAKSRAEAELRKALKGALALLGDDAPKGGG